MPVRKKILGWIEWVRPAKPTGVDGLTSGVSCNAQEGARSEEFWRQAPMWVRLGGSRGDTRDGYFSGETPQPPDLKIECGCEILRIRHL